jgi:hypothetical protein
MLKSLRNIVFLLLSNVAFGQSFINGDFEINSAIIDQVNLPNELFNAYMPNCNGFGTYGNLDIINSNTWGGGGAYSGAWYIALTAGGSDILSIELDMPLVTGNSYTITFYDRKDILYNTFPIEIGLSSSNNSFGTLVYTTPTLALDHIWTQRTFTFIAPNNGQFITVQQQGGYTVEWVHVDNFFFDCSINPDLGNDTTLCQGQSITLNGGSATSYLWSNGSTASSINVSAPGNYWVQASNEQCSAIDTIAITLDLLPEINLGNDTSFCNQIQHIISPTNSGGTISNFVWQDNSTGNSLITSNNGNYWLQASNSCGVSIDSINIVFFQAIIPSDTVFICPGSTFTLANGTNVNSPGTYSDTLNVLGYLGCDSIIQRVISWHPINNDTIQVALCSGTSFTTSSGIALTLPGFYSDTLNIQNQFGCDSIRVIEILNFPSVNSIQNTTICFGQSFILPDGSSQNTAGIYIINLTTASGCDSVITINLTLTPAITASQIIEICSGQSYILPSGISVNTAGTYFDTLTAASGCDSVITINLTLTPAIIVSINIELCSGQSYVLPSGITVNTAGTYLDTLTAASGCDSVIIINLNYYNDVFIPMIPEMGLCAK